MKRLFTKLVFTHSERRGEQRSLKLSSLKKKRAGHVSPYDANFLLKLFFVVRNVSTF